MNDFLGLNDGACLMCCGRAAVDAARHNRRVILMSGHSDQPLATLGLFFNKCPHVDKPEQFVYVDGFRAGVEVYQCVECGLYEVHVFDAFDSPTVYYTRDVGDLYGN